MTAAVAAGHHATVEAGVELLEEGGTAADAAVGASLAACVAESVMTGLLGGAHAIHWDGREARNLDCFVAVPTGAGAELVELAVPFGEELVHYAIGPGSCAVPGLPAGLEDLGAALRQALKTDVLPAFAGLKSHLEEEYLARSRPDAGLWSIPGGEETYRHLIRKYTTTRYSADEIHDLGHELLRDIMQRLGAIGAKLGHRGSPLDFVKDIKKDRKNFATSREQLLAAYAATFHRAQEALPRMFGRLPRTACEIRPIEPHAEKDAPGAYYYAPPLDGSRPGIFYANTYEPTGRALHEVETLTFHEAVPGHHLQIALGVENPALAQYRRYEPFDAFCEGWALYAEKLSEEMGLFSSDLARVGLLNAQAMRACRLVVDTGMHAKRWSRDQAIKFMSENISLSPHVIEVEVDRYMIWPGQALSYSVGMRRIDELRAEATRELGSRMDIRAFHDLVLEEGAIPLTVLDDRVKAWIAGLKDR